MSVFLLSYQVHEVALVYERYFEWTDLVLIVRLYLSTVALDCRHVHGECS